MKILSVVAVLLTSISLFAKTPTLEHGVKKSFILSQHYFGNPQAVIVDVDYKVIRGCFLRQQYNAFTNPMIASKMFVAKTPLLNPTVICLPHMERSLQMGLRKVVLPTKYLNRIYLELYTPIGSKVSVRPLRKFHPKAVVSLGVLNTKLVAIGGETTGFGIRNAKGKMIELILTKEQRQMIKTRHGKKVLIIGIKKIIDYVTRKNVKALKVLHFQIH